MRYSIILLLLLFTISVLSGQEEVLRVFYGEEQVYGQENVLSVEVLDNSYAVIGWREEGATQKDIIIWEFSTDGVLIDSLVKAMPGDQIPKLTHKGLDNGFLLVYEDKSIGVGNDKQLVYYNADLSERWTRTILREEYDVKRIHPVVFKTKDSLLLTFDNTALVDFNTSQGVVDTIFADVPNHVEIRSVEIDPYGKYLIGGSACPPDQLAGGFLAQISSEGSVDWQQIYSRGHWNVSGRARSVDFYTGFHRVEGQNLLVANYGWLLERTVQRFDTLGVSLGEERVEGISIRNYEQVEWLGDTLMVVTSRIGQWGGTFEMEDYRLTGNYLNAAYGWPSGGSAYDAVRKKYLNAWADVNTLDHVGNINVFDLPSNERSTTSFGRKNFEGAEQGIGLFVGESGDYSIMFKRRIERACHEYNVVGLSSEGRDLGTISKDTFKTPGSFRNVIPAQDGGYFLVEAAWDTCEVSKFSQEHEFEWSSSAQDRFNRGTDIRGVAGFSEELFLMQETEFDNRSVALVPTMISIFDSAHLETGVVIDSYIALGEIERQITSTSNGGFCLAGANLAKNICTIAMYGDGAMTPDWRTQLEIPGCVRYLASNPMVYYDQSVGVLVNGGVDSFSLASNDILTYFSLNSEGEITGSLELLREPFREEMIVVHRSPLVITLAVSLIDRNVIRLIDINIKTLEVSEPFDIESAFGSIDVVALRTLSDGKTVVLANTPSAAQSRTDDLLLVVVDVMDGLINDVASDETTEIIIVSPNPASSELNVSRISDQIVGPTSYRIFSGHGKLMSSGQLEGQRSSIDVSFLKSGTYFITTGTKETGPITTLFVKQ